MENSDIYKILVSELLSEGISIPQMDRIASKIMDLQTPPAPKTITSPHVDVFRSSRPPGQSSIVREWVAQLGPRMQGVLLTAIRGADTSPREAPIKSLARYFRGTVIHGLNDNPKTFIAVVDYNDAVARAAVMDLIVAIFADHDAYPHHYLMHLIHAAQIVGAFHPNAHCRSAWMAFYAGMCRKMHMNMETIEELRARLEEPSEAKFAAAQ